MDDLTAPIFDHDEGSREAPTTVPVPNHGHISRRPSGPGSPSLARLSLIVARLSRPVASIDLTAFALGDPDDDETSDLQDGREVEVFLARRHITIGGDR